MNNLPVISFFRVVPVFFAFLLAYSSYFLKKNKDAITKRILPILLISMGINGAFAQEEPSNSIYLTSELNVGNYFGLDVGLNYTFKESSIKIGYTGNLRKPKTQPEDFKWGLTGILFLGLINPYDQMANYYVGYGRVYNLNPGGTIRLNASAALGYSVVKEPTQWQKENNDGIWTGNYTWDYNQHGTVGLTINPKIEFLFSRFYGVTVSPMVQINKDRIYYGIGVGQMIGLLQKKKNRSQQKDKEQ